LTLGRPCRVVAATVGLCARALWLAGALYGLACGAHGAPADSARGQRAEALLPAAELPPPEPRQFRAAWVASVANIDWPSKPGLSTIAQQAEARAILDRARAIGLNALVLQVRPAGDALYASRLEPWSEYLTGRQGRAPQPWWDPLAFWVREAHRRGLALHAWFNPFRARHPTAKTPLATPHLALRVPGAVKSYGELLWMDPSEPAARAQMLAVVEDVLRRYDIDGVHIDDYFYPYPISQPSPEGGSDLAFPDGEAYLRYLGGGGDLPLPDWRRAHVDTLVKAIFETVRRVKPRVLFGISPFGLGRPDRRPPGVSGFSQYDKLYADVERWLEMGWLDYLAPQLYWPIDSAGQPFEPLLKSWVQANVRQRHLWPGLFTSSVKAMPSMGTEAAAVGAVGALGGSRSWPPREVLEQMALIAAEPAAGGHIHFSMSALMQDRDGMVTLMQRGPYASPALQPLTPWLGEGRVLPPPAPPSLLRRADAVFIASGAGTAVAQWAVWRRIEGRWRLAVLPAVERRLARERADVIVVSAVDRHGNVSARQALRWP
jgi:uncharacterized lipoprotein YddW (UPF0748 family)